MNDETLNNRGAPPATDLSGVPGDSNASRPLMPPPLDQPEQSAQPDQPVESAMPAMPSTPDVSQPAAQPAENGTPSWPLIPDRPDRPLDPTSPAGQSAGGDMPTLPAQQPTPAAPGMPGATYPSYPSYPGYTASPSAPLQPGAPGMPPGYPTYPSYPAYPGYPGAPSMPLQGYPGSPSMPMYSGPPTPTTPGWGAPLPPSYPSYPGYPGSPSLPFAPSMPSMPMQGAWMPTQRRSPLARPFPFWLSLLLTVGAVVLAALVYVADVVVAHGDWSSGARAAGVAALILGGVTLLLLVARLALGRRVLSTVVLSLLLAVLLLGGGAGGLAFANPLHGVQAQTLERGGDWSGAIYEYELAGETTPNAPDIARIYDEWGEQDFQQKSYKSAVEHFTTVIIHYNQSGAAVDRAQADLFKTYSAWVQANDPNVPYSDAIADFVAYRSNPQCDATCQTSARAVEAQARYQFGSQLLAQQQYTAAIEQFELVQSQFSDSPYAKQAHMAAAQAYLALGKQQLQSSCSDAIPTYQKLASQYGDTPEGAQAKAALAAPQDVTGVLVNYPTNPVPVIMLSRHADPNNYSFSADYTTLPGSGGKFAFNNVAQGKYNIATLRVTTTFIEETWYSNGNNLYTVIVGPLCPTDFGTYQYK